MATKPRRQDDQAHQIYGVYIASMLTMKVALNITEIGKNVKSNLAAKISSVTEGKCIAEGFVQRNSIEIVSYSSGNIAGDRVEFETVFRCRICHPVEGMLIECETKTITKAGIHAEVIDSDGNMPITAFVARDHHFSDRRFNEIKENMKITVKVVGVRYELNDPYICVIGIL